MWFLPAIEHEYKILSKFILNIFESTQVYISQNNSPHFHEESAIGFTRLSSIQGK